MMGLYGRNGSAWKLTVKSGDSWESLAKRAGLNERQFEDLMRANPNITMLKAGQTINTGGMRRNNDAYVSNYTAQAEGMANAGQLKDAYAANGTGGFGSARIRSPQPAVYAGNFGYNTTTKQGRAELAWQNNPNNPYGIAAQQPKTGAPNSTGVPFLTAQNRPNTPTAPTAQAQPTAPMQTGMQAAQNWQAGWQQQQATAQTQAAIAKGNSLEQGMNPQGGTPTPPGFVQGLHVQDSFKTNVNANPLNPGLPTSGYTQNSPQQPTPTAQAQPTATQGVTPTTTAPAVPDAMAAYNQQQQQFQAAQIASAFRAGANPALRPPVVTAQNISTLVAMNPYGATAAQYQQDLLSKGYVQDVSGNFVQVGDTSAQGGPSFSPNKYTVPSGYGDYAGLPAYVGPDYNYQTPHYNMPSGSGGGGSRRPQGYRTGIGGQRDQWDNWRIG